MLTLTRRGWAVALSALAVWGSWWWLGLRDLWYLAALLGSLVLVPLAITAIGPLASRVSVRTTITDPTPTVGDSVIMTAEVQQGARLGFQLALRWQIPGQRLTTRVPYKKLARTAIRLTPHQRGAREVGVIGVDHIGPLGMARMRLRLRSTVEILVLPELIPTLSELLGGGQLSLYGEDDSASVTSFRTSGVPGGAVREYQTGDTRRQIHWKQSARQGELLVNIHEHTDQPQRTFVLIADADAYRLFDEFERAVSAVATLAVYSIQQGCLVRIQYGSELLTCASADEALRHCAVITADAGELVLDGRPVHGVVTGAVTERVAATLAQLAPSVLLTASPGSADVPGWAQVTV